MNLLRMVWLGPVAQSGGVGETRAIGGDARGYAGSNPVIDNFTIFQNLSSSTFISLLPTSQDPASELPLKSTCLCPIT